MHRALSRIAVPLAAASVLIAAPAYAQGPANDGDSRAAGDVPAAADNPGAYGKNDAGGFRNVLPPGQNGLDTLGQILNFRLPAPYPSTGPTSNRSMTACSTPHRR